MSQSATEQAPEPQEPQPQATVTVWKIAAGVICGFPGIVALVLVVALYQILSDSVSEVRSAGPDHTKTVKASALCTEHPSAPWGQAVRLYAGDKVKPRMATGSIASVIPMTGVASGSMLHGCWVDRDSLE